MTTGRPRRRNLYADRWPSRLIGLEARPSRHPDTVSSRSARRGTHPGTRQRRDGKCPWLSELARSRKRDTSGLRWCGDAKCRRTIQTSTLSRSQRRSSHKAKQTISTNIYTLYIITNVMRSTYGGSPYRDDGHHSMGAYSATAWSILDRQSATTLALPAL